MRASNTGKPLEDSCTPRRAPGGARSYVYLPGLKSRFLRLELVEPSTGAVLRLQSFEFSRSIHAFWYAVAAAEARGWHPRWLHREQSEWTPIGTSNGTQCALMNGDGMVEVGEGSFSIEPMLWIEGRLFTWADVAPRQELAERWMPVPSVIWESEQWRLRCRRRPRRTGELRVRYRFENLTDAPLSARLFVVVRPFQVTPPWQNFRNLGGVSRDPRSRVGRDGCACAVNRERMLRSRPRSRLPAASARCASMTGCIAARLHRGARAGRAPRCTIAFGFASGALRIRSWSPPARESCERVLRAACRRGCGAPCGRAGRSTGRRECRIDAVVGQRLDRARPSRRRSRRRRISSSPARGRRCSPARGATRAPGSETAP